MAGCLSRNLEEWRTIGAEEWVLTVLENGYRIPFVTRPPLCLNPWGFGTYSPNSEKGKALDMEVKLLLDKEAIEEAPMSPGFLSHVFVVTKATGGYRPVLDLSSLNKYVHTTKFRMETVRTVLAAIHKDDWMTSVDLKDAYFQIPIHRESRRYLRFIWKGQLYQFRVLCFGLSTAPQVFTRMMAPISAALHQRGVRLLRYLDDWLVLAASEQEALQSTQVLLDLCSRLGVMINWEKSALTPTQTKIFLGMEIHSPLLKVFPTHTRVDNLLRLIRAFLSNQCPPAKEWMVLLGHLASLIYLVPGGRRRMRNLQLQLSRSWNRQLQSETVAIPWTTHICADLLWWSNESNLWSGQSLQLVSPDLCLYTDASSDGWGASVLHDSTSGSWSPLEKSLHINLLELRAIRLGLQYFVELVRGKTVAIFSDNTTALSYLAKEGGTRSYLLNLEAQETLDWAERNSVNLLCQFVRGSSNVLADCLSRKSQVISTEWTLHQEVCNTLWKVWGCPLVDLFATRLNFRLANFISPFQDPMAIATDAFLYNWDHQELYAFPPFSLVRKVLNKLKISQGTTLILVAPFWPQKEWFPDLIQATSDTPRRLPLRQDLLRQPHIHRFHQALHALPLVAWRLSSDSCVTRAIQDELRSSWRRLDAIPLL